MAQDEPATAADCYQQLQQVAERLERLHAAGRLRMSSDASNTAWPDLDAAVRAALASLDVAIQATAWMDTATTAQGGGAR